MLWVKRGLQALGVVIGVTLLTSFTIDATDSLNGSQSALSFLAKQMSVSSCPSNMVEVSLADRSLCVDIYENSFSPACPIKKPASALDTQQNINDSSCQSLSASEEQPAVFVTFHQAQNFCARRGGRLPNAYEWYDMALGTPDTDVCNVDGSLAQTGNFTDCVSSRGVHDLIGNAWEWIDAEVVNGTFSDRALPPTGFVAEADRAGVAIATADEPSELFNSDYFWSTVDGTTAMMRGGFYGSGSDGGVYSIHAAVAPTFTSGAVGFRCVIDV